MMSISAYLKSYQCGDYKHYLHIVCGETTQIDTSKFIKDFSELTKLHGIVTRLLLQNNETVCQAILQLGSNEPQWLELLQQFISLFSTHKSLQEVPIEMEMNVIYNMLWWFWIRPQSLSYASHHLKDILKAVSWCLTKVVRSNREVVLGQQMCSDDVTGVVDLLKRASDKLLCLEPPACVQLLDIITMTIQVLLREKLTEAAADCVCFMTKIVEQIDILRHHTERNKIAGSEEFYFKFGFNLINSTASLKNSGDSIDTFISTSSLNCAVNEEYEQAVKCFKGMSEGEGSYNFMVNYLKAHCCLMTQHLNEAKLCLAYIMSGPVPPIHLAHYRLLLARLLGAQGDPKAALVQCDSVLASHSTHLSLTRLAAHLASQQASKLRATTPQLNYLRQLVQVLKTVSIQESGDFESFEECCLITLTRQFSISLPEALYSLARQFYLAGYHVKSLDCYKEVLDIVKTQEPEPSALLPGKSQLVQECVLAHIKSNSLSGGEQLCRQLVSEHLPHTGGGRGTCSAWEVALYSIEDDVVGLLMLADILTAAGNQRKALEELNRCQSALTEWQEHATCETDQVLCAWLLSRVLLRKAKASSINDAAQYFRRALIHKPGDKEVMFHYKQWSLWHPDHESFDPGDAAAAVTFPVDDIYNLAVRHVLSCGVSEEEWNHLFDHHTSQNIIESLFDDDD